MSSIPSIPLYFAGLYFFHGTEKDWFWTGAFVCLWILVIRMGWKNYRLMEAIKSPNKPDLGFEPVPSDSVPAKRHPFHVRILNKNPNRNADDLKVEVISFTDNLSGQFQNVAKRYFHPSHFDKVAELKSATGRNTINPRDGLEFIVFHFESAIKIQGQPRSVIATFDLKNTNTKENVASFHENKEYRIRFAASARDMARVEKEFEFYFLEIDGVCQIKVKAVSEFTEAEKSERRQKAQKTAEKLTELGQTIFQRISEINGINHNQYNAAKDDKTRDAISATRAYIFLNFTPEAVQIFDEGINDIHGCFLAPPGVGSTRYEDAYREVLARLERWFRNLKKIIDEIDKYLK